MPNRVMVAIVAAVGLLSSTIALAAAPSGTAREGLSTVLEVPAVVAASLTTPATVESLTGQLAVAHVVLERARSGRFPAGLCAVVKQPRQFSFVRKGRLPTPTHHGQWRTARAIAQIALDGAWDNPVEGALFFHSSRISPNWKRDRLTRIGGHIFYR